MYRPSRRKGERYLDPQENVLGIHGRRALVEAAGTRAGSADGAAFHGGARAAPRRIRYSGGLSCAGCGWDRIRAKRIVWATLSLPGKAGALFSTRQDTRGHGMGLRARRIRGTWLARSGFRTGPRPGTSAAGSFPREARTGIQCRHDGHQFVCRRTDRPRLRGPRSRSPDRVRRKQRTHRLVWRASLCQPISTDRCAHVDPRCHRGPLQQCRTGPAPRLRTARPAALAG